MTETTKTDRHIVGAKGEIVAHVRRTREDFEKRYGPISFGVPGVSNIISVAVAREIADALQAVIADVEPPAPAPLDECEHAVTVERAAEMLRLLDISLLTAAAHLRRSDILALASIPALLAALKEAQSHESLRPNERAAYEAALEENRTLRAQLEEARRRHDEVAGERDALREAVDETDPVGSLAGDLAASTRRIVALRDALARAVEIIERVLEFAPADECPGCQGGADSYADALSALRAFVREQKGEG